MEEQLSGLEVGHNSPYTSFLKDGGEMGELTRNFNWSTTSIGTPDHWPQNLLTTVDIILHSKFPMFLWWGDNMLQFYNDAYMSALGNEGKHPKALGQTGKECWAETWDIIYPMIVQVQTTGVSIWCEDQLIPIFRNGKIENVYWTYSYSAVAGKNNRCAGILVTCFETTEKVNNLRQLQESKDQLHFAIEAADLGTWDLNPFTNKFTGNDRLKEWFGLLPEEKIKPSLALSLIAEKDRQRVIDAIKYSLQYTSGGYYDIECTIINPYTKEERIVKAKGKAAFNNKNIAYRFNGTLQDITKEAIAKRKADESERNIRNMIIQSPVAMCILKGAEFIVEIANYKMFELWGKEESLLMSKPIFEGLPEAKEQGLEQILHKVLTTGDRFTANERPINLPRNGKIELVYVNFAYEAVKEGDGSISGIMAVAVDVTEQVVARKKIEEAEERARLAIASAELGVYEVYFDNEHILCNKRCYEIFDLHKVFTRTDFINTLHPDDIEIRNNAYKTVLETGVLHYEARVIWRDKSVHWVRIKGTVIFRETGVPIKLLGVAQDITAQKEFAEALEKRVAERTKELAEANLKLQQSNTELNQFAYIASHDLQEPLRKVRTFTDMMQRSLGAVSEKTNNYITKINRSTERMQDLINDVLKFSLLTKEREQFEEVDMNDVVNDILGDFELLIEQKGAKVKSGILPVIQAVSLQMGQLMNNLISNSLKFSSTERQIEISIKSFALSKEAIRQYNELDNDKLHYQFEFKDNGIGFNQQNAEKIFTMFQRLHGKSEYSGTGIGLAMVKKIVQNHHGIIYANSIPDEGSTFVIILPQSQNKLSQQ